ncbi:Zinc finger CCCH domain-containing protein 34 [Platanthera zijinensis]|uniref:Zinc finger CCCH domain-containing protein 34 n=1 Tax=Platanthera zijinensis TaxID=2320716 RepID=A0AAP0AV59_9ASPA
MDSTSKMPQCHCPGSFPNPTQAHQPRIPLLKPPTLQQPQMDAFNCQLPPPACPLEGLSGIKADSFYTPSFSTAPATKSNVPCYFYFNAVCAKGEQCPFLHETFLTQKSASKIAPESTTSRHPLENKSSAGDTGPASIELPGNPPAESLVGPIKTNNHHLNEAPRSPSVESTAPECEEPPAENPLPSVEFIDHPVQLSPYSSSEGELMKECAGQELDERWESSPGFDVLVDDGSEQLAYEDDADYQLVQNCESELRHSHLLKYDFDGSGYEHPSGYPEAGYLYDGLYENYDHIDDMYCGAEYFQRMSELTREERRIFEPIYDGLHERAMLRRVHEFDDRDDVMDLPDRLGKQRRTDARWIPFSSRKRRRTDSHGSGRERSGRRGDGSILGRLGSQVGRCPGSASSHDEDEFARNHHDRQGINQGTSRSTRSKIRERERRRRFPSRVSSEAHQGSSRDGEEFARMSNGGFDGPKTLAQIKEERNRAKAEDGQDCPDRLPLRTRHVALDFEGPKPLEELLKHKSSARPQSSMRAKMENLGVDECEDDEGDDVDAFRKRLAHVLSH